MLHCVLIALRTANKVNSIDTSKLEAIKERRLREMQMEDTLHRMIVYSFYVLILYIISYAHRDTNSYFVTQTIRDHLVSGPHGFSKVHV